MNYWAVVHATVPHPTCRVATDSRKTRFSFPSISTVQPFRVPRQRLPFVPGSPLACRDKATRLHPRRSSVRCRDQLRSSSHPPCVKSLRVGGAKFRIQKSEFRIQNSEFSNRTSHFPLPTTHFFSASSIFVACHATACHCPLRRR